MNRIIQPLFICISSVASLLILGWCEAKENEENVLAIGVIAPFIEVAQAWGETTLNYAEAVAEYYNERVGLEVDGERLKIYLFVRGDSFNSILVAGIAHQMVIDDIY